MRAVIAISVTATVFFAACCAALATVTRPAPYMLMATAGLLCAFVIAAIALVQDRTGVSARIGAVSLVLLGTPVAWVLRVNVGRIAAGLLGASS